MTSLEKLPTLQNHTAFGAAMNDIRRSIRRFPISVFLATEDIRDRFNRMALGIFWLPISFTLFVLVKVMIFASLNEASVSWFFVYTALGLWVWTFMVALIVDGCNAFTHSASYIKVTDLPFGLYCGRVICRNFVPFALGFAVIVLAIPFFRESYHIKGLLWSVPVFILYIVNGLWVTLLLGIICTIFRDFTQVVQTLMKMLFFLTPVLWVPSKLGAVGLKVALYNPFSHYIAIIRDPIVYGTVPLLSWGIVMFITVIGLMLAIFCFGRGLPHIYYNV